MSFCCFEQRVQIQWPEGSFRTVGIGGELKDWKGDNELCVYARAPLSFTSFSPQFILRYRGRN
jgi:hypothetical protein